MQGISLVETISTYFTFTDVSSVCRKKEEPMYIEDINDEYIEPNREHSGFSLTME